MNKESLRKFVEMTNSGFLLEQESNMLALEALEKLVDYNCVVHLNIGQTNMNEEPYFKPIYYLSIGHEYEDGAETIIFYPDYLGSGDTLLEAIKDLVERMDSKENKNKDYTDYVI